MYKAFKCNPRTPFPPPHTFTRCYPNVWRIKLYLSNFLFCIKIVSLPQIRHSSVHVIANCNRLTNTKGQKILYKLPELPHPLLRSSSSKTTTIVREQRYTRIKYSCKAVHLQKIESFGRGQNTPLWRPPLHQT